MAAAIGEQTAPIPMNLAVEDALCEAAIVKLIAGRSYYFNTIYNTGGYGYLKKNMPAFNFASKHTPFLVLTDLDNTYPCPSELIGTWLNRRDKHHNLLLRVAVREVEAWFLADKEALGSYLSSEIINVPDDVEIITDPKNLIIDISRKSSRKEIREDMCPKSQTTSKIGPNYNARMVHFAQNNWRPNIARQHSNSLNRTILRLEQYRPIWPINELPA